MPHNFTQCLPDTDTLIATATDSFIYECPVCNTQRRYAEPTDGSNIYCDRLDFGTKVEASGTLIEVSHAQYIKDNYTTAMFIAEHPLGLEAFGLVELTIVDVDTNAMGYMLTDLGKAFN